MLRSVKKFKVSDYAFLLIKVFGCGIILSTAFIHVYPSATFALQNPCLPEEFLNAYGATPGAIALASAFFVQLIQTIAIGHFSGKSKSEHKHEDHAHDNHDHAHSHNESNAPVKATATDLEAAQVPSSSDEEDRASNEIKMKAVEGNQNLELNAMSVAANIHSDACGAHLHQFYATSSHNHQKITTVLLEVGVSIHSILIGITLGVSRGPEATALLIAIAFHQFFEGIALSTTALDSGFKNVFYPLLFAFIYTLITPLGVAIGIGISQAFNENDVASLITIGVFEAIAAGILIHDGFVNLLTAYLTHNHSFYNFSLSKRALVFMSLWLGAGVMAVIGIWA